MTESPHAPQLTVELTAEQIDLVRTALRLLLASEEDVEELREIKVLLTRLDAAGGEVPAR
jgi:Arc/MetJ-type ribon-helix-helix transcriptional regulator